jgi:cell division septum initiation protein DivIVA
MKTKNEKYDALKKKCVELKHINNLNSEEVDALYLQHFGPEGGTADPSIQTGDNTDSGENQTLPDADNQGFLEEAKKEADDIIEAAKAEAVQIIESAKESGNEIVKEAEDKAAELIGKEAEQDEEEDNSDVEVSPLVFKTSGWCEELQMSFKKGIYHPKSAKEYIGLKKYAAQE